MDVMEESGQRCRQEGAGLGGWGVAKGSLRPCTEAPNPLSLASHQPSLLEPPRVAEAETGRVDPHQGQPPPKPLRPTRFSWKYAVLSSPECKCVQPGLHGGPGSVQTPGEEGLI